MSRVSLLVILVISTIPIWAQPVDTTAVREVLIVQKTLDSLRQQLRRLEDELTTIKSDVAVGSDFEKLVASLTDQEYDETPEDQRSKRKRVDALLKALTARPGQLRFNGGTTVIWQWNPRAANSFSTATGSLDIYAHTSFSQQTLLFFDFEAIGGNGPAHFIPSLSSLNADAGSTQDSDGIDRLTISEAWSEFTAFDEALTFTAGKIDLTNYFDNNRVANDETSQFFSAAFVNSSALPSPGSTPGVRIRTTLVKRFYIQAALVSPTNSSDNISGNPFKIASVGFKVLPETDLEGNVRIYGYLHPLAQNNGGYGVSFDQSIVNGVSIFARWNKNEEALGQWFGISRAWSGGGRYSAFIQGRKLVIALAYGETKPIAFSLSTEQTLEAYVRHQLNKWSFVSPHVQWVRNLGGQATSLFLFGLRTQFDF